MGLTRNAIISGTGMYVPEQVVTNHDLEQLMDTSDEWIQKRTGIKERRFIESGKGPSDLGVLACQNAMRDAGCKIEDIDLLIVATLSPDHFFPGTSAFMQRKLGMGTKPAMDIRNQCSGFLFALNTAKLFVQSGQYNRVMVCGTEVHSRALEMNDRGRDVAVLFGDGAGAVILEATDDPERGILSCSLHTEGEHAEKLWVELPGLAHEPHISAELIEEGKVFPKMDGRYVFKHAVTRLPQVVMESLQPLHLTPKDIDHYFFHQANLRINEHVGEVLGIEPHKVHNNIQKYGNCSAASIPMAIAEARAEGKVKRGQLACLAAFGSGFTWASAVIRW